MGGKRLRESAATRVFPLALHRKKAQTHRMTTVKKPFGFCGWSIRCASVVISLAFCASAFADPSKNVVTQAQPAKVKKVCYVYITGSDIPQPCERLGVIPTTAYALDRVGGSH